MLPTDMDTGTDTDDVQVMLRVQAGELDAFTRLVERHQKPLLNFFRRMGVNMEAEDMVQETLVRVYNYREKYRPAARFTTFLYTVARHVWLDSVRRKSRFLDFFKKEQVILPATDDGGLRGARLRMDVEAALGRLPEKMRAVIVLSVFQGLQYEAIAEVLGVPVGTVKSRVFNALEQLKEIFDDK